MAQPEGRWTKQLDGLSEDTLQQLEGGGNTIAFLATHLTDTRHFLANRLGHPLANPLSRYLAQASSIEEIVEWPTLGQMGFLRRQLGKPAMSYTRGAG